MEEIFERIRSLLASQLDIEEDRITMDSNFVEDFEADSLDVVDMVMSLEDEFGIEIETESNPETVGELVELIESLMEN